MTQDIFRKPFTILILLFGVFRPCFPTQPDSTEINIYELLLKGQYERVKKHMQQKIKTDSIHAENYYLLGTAFQYSQDYSGALEAFQKAYAIDPFFMNNMVSLAHTYVTMLNLDRAEELYVQIIGSDSSRMDIYDSLGRIYYRKGDFTKALSIYRRLTTAAPSNGYYHLMKARCEQNLDQIDGAIQTYKTAQRLDRQNIQIITELGRILLNSEQYDSVLVYAGRGLAINNRDANLFRLQADAFFKKEDYERATLAFLDAQVRGDNSVEVYKRLGFCYYKIKKYKEAVEVFTHAFNQDSKDPLTAFYLGNCFAQIKQYPLAIRFFNLSIELTIPDYFDYLYSQLGESYFEKKQYEEAIRAFRKAKEYSDKPEIYDYQLANVYYDYYADRQVPLYYYEKVLEQNISPEINEFCRDRITWLKKEIHFGKAKSK